jgi:ATP-dependent Clp protease protease subunit
MRDEADSKQDEKQPSESLTRRLLDARSVLLFGPIEPKVTQRVIRELVILNEMDREKPIRLYVNSPGGYADDGFAIYDVMRFIDAPVYTLCTGLAASAATIVMVGGEKGHRYTMAHSRLMLHQPSSGAQGTASDIAITAREIIRLREKANELFARETGHPIDKIQRDMGRDYWLSAEEAVEYKMLDKIVLSESEIG